MDGGQIRGRQLPLPRTWDIAVLRIAVACLLMFNLPLQTLEIEVAQGVWAETAGLEVLVACDIGVLLQQVGYAAKDGGPDAIGMQALEQEQRFEVGVGRAASMHPPGVWGARAMMGLGGNGSQRDERQRLWEAGGHGTRLGSWARRAEGFWAMGG